MNTLDLYAIIGNPVAHSKSPEIHHQFAEQTQQSLQYERLLAPLDQFAPTVRAFMSKGGQGCNVTLPFKEQAFAMVDDYSEYAKQAKAINTIVRRSDGRLYGDNTDGIGLVRDLQENLKWPIQGKRILLIGAGGAVRGILPALLAENPAQIAIANRTMGRVQELTDDFGILPYSLDELPKQPFDIIINGTSASLSGAIPALPDYLNMSQSYCYDMAYAEKPSAFLQWALQRRGAKGIADGLGMLVEQAAESFFLWREVKPDTQAVRQQLATWKT